MITFRLDMPSVWAITAEYATRNGAARSPSDFEAQSGRITFEPGETETTIEIPIIDDGRIEDDESFTVLASEGMRNNGRRVPFDPTPNNVTILDTGDWDMNGPEEPP